MSRLHPAGARFASAQHGLTRKQSARAYRPQCMVVAQMRARQ
ncbi:hypothetical protein [Xanthomonas arboricola]|nr:hypothetical protein [Xanthomonas arboricola]MBB4708871.1 hypothetical protein [Xanthomonas arboricola]